MVAESADGKRLLLEQEKGQRSTLIVLDIESGKTLCELPQKKENVCSSLSPDGRTVALAVADQLTFVNVDSGRERKYALSHGEKDIRFSSNLIFSPDGAEYRLSGRERQHASRVRARWSATGPVSAGERAAHWGLAFSPDGKLCVCDTERMPSLWEVATSQRIRTFIGSSCLFSPDNRLLAIESDNDLRLHDLYSGKTIRKCKDVVGPAKKGNYAFSSDGKRLATASQDTTVLLWDTTAPQTADKTAPLDEKALERLWKNMETADVPDAYVAMGQLISDPELTVPFLRKRLRPIPPIEEKRLRQWIADLNSDSFEKRDTASRELGRLGLLAERPLRAASRKRIR